MDKKMIDEKMIDESDDYYKAFLAEEQFQKELSDVVRQLEEVSKDPSFTCVSTTALDLELYEKINGKPQ